MGLMTFIVKGRSSSASIIGKDEYGVGRARRNIGVALGLSARFAFALVQYARSGKNTFGKLVFNSL